ncbi:hypothetical protein GUJ93_ZPchr0002g23931 [Zizania palustris]|uniref:Uncharacterized protein n=1 Tax=Zizania palustris TaxID=103762 RepID=A0A8J5V350_ZIZPA|nr:hypothetical protein GUJ93_ZPchr0002g23931 [Zizania palustris]
MPKKTSSKKAASLGGGSSSVQVQVDAAATNPPARCLGALDLRSPSDKFDQTLELQASASTKETIIAAEHVMRPPTLDEHDRRVDLVGAGRAGLEATDVEDTFSRSESSDESSEGESEGGSLDEADGEADRTKWSLWSLWTKPLTSWAGARP